MKFIFVFLNCEKNWFILYTLMHFVVKNEVYKYTLLSQTKWTCTFCFRFLLQTLTPTRGNNLTLILKKIFKLIVVNSRLKFLYLIILNSIKLSLFFKAAIKLSSLAVELTIAIFQFLKFYQTSSCYLSTKWKVTQI
jgi:hypothetical protein